MKPLRRVISDPGIYGLLLLNLFFIYEFREDPSIYSTIVLLYWIQSVLIGVFNFVELLTTSNIQAGDFKMNNVPVDPKKGTGCYSIFFLCHFQFFHIAYIFFLSSMLKWNTIDYAYVKTAVLGILLSLVIIFIQHKIRYKTEAPKLGAMFFSPYLRIVPMHFMILIPAFLELSPAIIFLVLKTIFDLIGHIISTPYYWKKETLVTGEYVAR